MYEYASLVGEVKPDSKDNNLFRYCGEYYDKETEEIYLRARYYQPEMGRFLTRDTYTGEEDEPESLHLYAYCENDGVNMVDPNGNNAFALWSTGAGGLCAIDGPAPVGDIIYVMGLAISGIITVTSADNKPQTVVKPAPVPVPQKEVPEKSIDRKKIKEKEIQAIAKAAVQIKKKAKQHKKRYFELHMSKLPISKEMIAVIGKSITKAKAVSRLKSQKDTITWFGYNAKKIANLAGNGKTPLYHNDKDDLTSKRGCPQFRHYHPRGKRSHSAYVV